MQNSARPVEWSYDLFAGRNRAMTASTDRNITMSTAAHYPHISVDASGTARVDQTRYKVEHLAAEHYYHGWTAEELLRQHPDLRPEQVYSALAYFYDHYDELTARMDSSASMAEQGRQSQALSRDQLLKRGRPGTS